ncbi:hypothetical protein, unknown function [Leishmania tarentolae]|uniref:Uncharacterized protein n=1 Tax=Leishmania tarentolae TaxID=5689 RepID=A0A640KPG2_LEITA|nr:hypothetical protein, unknown function [Leishmania tarentolae]
MSDSVEAASLTRTCAPHEVRVLLSCSTDAPAVAPASSSEVTKSHAPQQPIASTPTSFDSLMDTHRGRHAGPHASPPHRLRRPFPSAQPSFRDVAERRGSSNEKCEPNSLFSSHMRLGDTSTLGISASTSTIPAACSDSTTSSHWLRIAEDRARPQSRTVERDPMSLRRHAEYVFERWVQPNVHRTTEMDAAMLMVASAFGERSA